MTLATSLVVLFNCYATADILTKLLRQCFLFSLLLLYLGNSQVSVYRTIGPTLGLFIESQLLYDRLLLSELALTLITLFKGIYYCMIRD